MHIREGTGIIAPSYYSLINVRSFAILNSGISGRTVLFRRSFERIESYTHLDESRSKVGRVVDRWNIRNSNYPPRINYREEKKNFFAVVRGISSFSSNEKYDDRRGGGSSTIDPSVKNIFNYLGSSIEEL